eukprot:155258-Prymnesium_polylepis.1
MAPGVASWAGCSARANRSSSRWARRSSPSGRGPSCAARPPIDAWTRSARQPPTRPGSAGSRTRGACWAWAVATAASREANLAP